MNDVRMAIIAATGTARKRIIPAVRERNLCAIAAVHGRDRDKLAALATQNGIPCYFVDAERMLEPPQVVTLRGHDLRLPDCPDVGGGGRRYPPTDASDS